MEVEYMGVEYGKGTPLPIGEENEEKARHFLSPFFGHILVQSPVHLSIAKLLLGCKPVIRPGPDLQYACPV